MVKLKVQARSDTNWNANKETGIGQTGSKIILFFILKK